MFIGNMFVYIFNIGACLLSKKEKDVFGFYHKFNLVQRSIVALSGFSPFKSQLRGIELYVYVVFVICIFYYDFLFLS
jgi:hypothetical protein